MEKPAPNDHLNVDAVVVADAVVDDGDDDCGYDCGCCCGSHWSVLHASAPFPACVTGAGH